MPRWLDVFSLKASADSQKSVEQRWMGPRNDSQLTSLVYKNVRSYVVPDDPVPRLGVVKVNQISGFGWLHVQCHTVLYFRCLSQPDQAISSPGMTFFTVFAGTPADEISHSKLTEPKTHRPGGETELECGCKLPSEFFRFPV